jgi:CHAT domain-containing protein
MRAALLLLLLLIAAPAAYADDDPDDDSPAVADEGDSKRLTPEDAAKVLALPAPAATASRKDQVAFHERRQQAAFTAGDAAARIESLRRLAELTEERDKPSKWTSYLWREMSRNGNQTEALELGEKLVADSRYPVRVRALHRVRLGNDYLRHGQPQKARAILALSDEEIAKGPPPGVALDRTFNELRADTEHLRAGLLQKDGDFAGAEESARKSVAWAQEEVEYARKVSKKGDTWPDVAVRSRASQMQRQISVYMAQGKHLQAEAVARYGLRLAEQENTGGTTLALWHSRIALAKLGQRRYEDAYKSAKDAIETYRAAGVDGSSERMVTANIYLMQALFGLQRWAEADQVAGAMREEAADDSMARSRLDNAVLQAFLHLVNGRTDAAMKRIEGTIRARARNYGETATTTIEAKAVRAMVHQANQHTAQALQDYRQVLDSIFSPETSFADAEPAGLRGFVMPHALRSYLRLAAAAYAEGGGKLADARMLDDSFRVADRLRASVVQQALIDSAARAAASNPELKETIRREQDERARTRELTSQLTRQLEEDRRLAAEFKERQAATSDEKQKKAQAAEEKARAKARQDDIKGARDAVQQADEKRRAVMRDLATRFPEYQALVNPKPPTLTDAAALLGRDEALVSIYPTSDGTFVWAASGTGAKGFHHAALRAEDVAALAARMRKTLDVGHVRDPAGTLFDFAASAKLFAELVAPVWKTVGDAKTVIFAVNGPLAQVPLATLVTASAPADLAAAPWLVRQAAVVQVSTVASLQALRTTRKVARAEKAFAGFGDPAFKAAAVAAQPRAVRAVLKEPIASRGAALDYDYGTLPPLPETRAEIASIARSLGADPQRDVYFGPQASRQAALGTDLASRRVVAFATHGLKPGDLPGLSRPALAMAAAANATDSPLLVLDDVMTMKLNADLVVLSACNTASDDGSAGEAFSGLARGFFFAGARSVLATQWAVESLSAEDLVKRTFTHVAQGVTNRAEALRRAQLELLGGKEYRHPFYWSPYVLSGDPGA